MILSIISEPLAPGNAGASELATSWVVSLKAISMVVVEPGETVAADE
tara:strand:- start:1057 stop:1197 length:141 start_codon:yes stop_codon:yes gene_type:complete